MAEGAHPGEDRSGPVREIARLISEWGAGGKDRLFQLLVSELGDFPEVALRRTIERVASTGEHWGYHRADLVARTISRAIHGVVLESSSKLIDAGNVEIARARPVIFLGNHLSFVDANVVDALLSSASLEEVANRLTVIVGPKVFSQPIHRLASLCFGVIKIPQSTTRASDEAVMSLREVARLAGDTLQSVRTRQEDGDHLLIFVEGSRSRTGAMQPALTAVARYLEHPDALIIPFGIWGTDKLMPLGEEHVHPAEVTLRFGRPVDAAALRALCPRRALLAQSVGFLIADLLPAAHRGHYATAKGELATARAAASALGQP